MKFLQVLRYFVNHKWYFVTRFLTDYDFPIFHCVRHFVGASYFGETDTTDDENNQARYVLESLLAFVLVPLTVSHAEIDVNLEISVDGKKSRQLFKILF